MCVCVCVCVCVRACLCVFELGYNIKKRTEISVALRKGYNAVVNCRELIGDTECLTQ